MNVRVPKLRQGSFFPEGVLTRYQRVGRAPAAVAAEMHAAGASTRKVQKVARKMGIGRLSKDQASAIARDLGADVEEPPSRDLGGLGMPCLWPDATYVKRGRGGRIASAAVVAAIGRDEHGWGYALGAAAVDAEPYDSWLSLLKGVRACGVEGVWLVVTDAH